jgi:hypothetical protein
MYPGIAIDAVPPSGIVKEPDSVHRIDKKETKVTIALSSPRDKPRVIVAKLLVLGDPLIRLSVAWLTAFGSRLGHQANAESARSATVASDMGIRCR